MLRTGVTRRHFHKPHGIAMAFAMLCCLLAARPTEAQLVTWVKPSPDAASGLALQSLAEGVTLEIADAENGKVVDNTRRLGWRFEDFDLGPVLMARGSGRGNTRPVRLTIGNLPPGEHKVIVRYWSMATKGQGYYVLRVGKGSKGKLTWAKWNTWDRFEDMHLVNGLGGYEGGLFDIQLATMGSREEPVEEVTLRFDRYKWGAVARFGGVRIETDPSVEFPKTAERFLDREGKRVRDTLLRYGQDTTGGLADFGVASTTASLKVRPKSFDDLKDVPLRPRIEISGARGEYVNSQVVLYSPSRDLDIEALEVSTLVHPETGETIDPSNILFAPIGYLYLDRPYELEKHGWWPEPILPFLASGFTAAKGDAQTLWYRIQVPQDAEAGVYQGTATIRPTQGPNAELPVEFRVYDFAVPARFSLPNAITASFVERMTEDGDLFLLDYGINPTGLYSSSSPTRAQLEKWAKDGQINAFNVRYLTQGYIDGLASGNPDPQQLRGILDQVERCLRDAEEVGLRDEAYFYMFDEVEDDALPAMETFTRAVHERFPDLFMLTTSKAAGTHGRENVLPYLEGWCPLIPGYSMERAEQARQTRSREIWWYTANTPRPPYPNFFTTQPAMAHRVLMGFMAYAMKTEGFLYWRIEKWWRGKPPISEGPYVREHWIARESGQWLQRGPDGPLPSIKLEMFRDGLEDYEYLKLAQERIDRLSSSAPFAVRRQAVELRRFFQPGNAIFKDFANFTTDPEALRRYRVQLAEFIELTND